jgi:hypothetical protein
MPDEQETKLDWQKVMEVGAESLAGGIATALIGQMLGEREQNDTQAIVTKAVEEICTRLTKVIDNAFMQEYIADTNSIASRLLTYRETNDVSILDEIYAESSNIVERLRRFDNIESITALNYISTLHLTCIKALAEHNPGYNETLKRVGAEFAERSRPTAKRLIEHTAASTGNVFPVNFIQSNSYSIGYRIDAFFEDHPKITFHTTYKDNWVPSDSKESNKWITSEPIPINKSLVSMREFGSFTRTLTEQAKEDKTLLEEVRKFNEYAKQIRQQHLDLRLNVANGMKDSILRACDAWSALQ